MRQRYEFTETGMVPHKDGIWVKTTPLEVEASEAMIGLFDRATGKDTPIAVIASAPDWKLKTNCKAMVAHAGYETDFADWSPEGAFWGTQVNLSQRLDKIVNLFKDAEQLTAKLVRDIELANPHKPIDVRV